MLFGNQVIRKIIVTLTLCLLTTLTFASESIQVVKATLGTGKAATDVAGQVKAIVASKGSAVISSVGLSVRNPKGYFRDRVTVYYQSGDVKKAITLTNGTSVNLSQLLQMN